jgi:hypothetical protein
MNSTDHNDHSEVDNPSANQEISRLFWNSAVYYRVHKRPPLDSYTVAYESRPRNHTLLSEHND